jgi:outer membrane biogenesis lipoprotein LolB
MKNKIFFTHIFLLLFGILILSSGCKNAKQQKHLQVKKLENIIHSHYTHAPDFHFLEGKAKVHFNNGDNSYKFTLKYRIEKDRIIWLQANMLGFPLAKMKITPGKVEFYERIKNQCFSGNFELIHQKLGIELDYNALQNIFLGLALQSLTAENYRMETDGNTYKILPVNHNDTYNFGYWIHPETYKITKEQISSSGGSIKILYPEYESIQDNHYPKNIIITGQNKTESIQIEMQVIRLTLPVELRFPFHLPDSCNPIDLSE